MRAVEEDLAAAEAAGDGETAADLRLLRTELRGRRIEAQAERAGATGRLQRFEAATVPLRPFRPQPERDAAIAAVLALLAVYGTAFLRVALRTNVADPDDLARVTGLPVLATFPRTPGGRTRLPTDSAAYLRTAVEFGTTDAHPKVLLVTSAGTGDGKSSVAIALASSFARRGDRTLLIDGDLRDPVLAKEFGIDAEKVPTLANALRDPGKRFVPAEVDIGGQVSFDLLPSVAFKTGLPSSQNPTDLLSDGFAGVIERAEKENYDVIVVDSAPILPVADALSIAESVTGAVLVARLPESDARSVRQALALLLRMRVRVFGAVATNVAGVARRRPGAYGMGYRQAAVPDEPSRP
jgi:capsular exopolysaccharide synthesis family protein